MELYSLKQGKWDNIATQVCFNKRRRESIWMSLEVTEKLIYSYQTFP